jgi:hypothetical protein
MECRVRRSIVITEDDFFRAAEKRENSWKRVLDSPPTIGPILPSNLAARAPQAKAPIGTGSQRLDLKEVNVGGM